MSTPLNVQTHFPIELDIYFYNFPIKPKIYSLVERKPSLSPKKFKFNLMDTRRTQFTRRGTDFSSIFFRFCCFKVSFL